MYLFPLLSKKKKKTGYIILRQERQASYRQTAYAGTDEYEQQQAEQE
jgi:hypothetical protein